MKKKGFTLVELLVVIAIIALLMGILMPALARVRMIAYRMICGTNLAGIGKGILLYANDNKEEYPFPGVIKNTIWSKVGQLKQWAPCATDGPDKVFQGNMATMSSVFYYLVKWEDVPTKEFNCKGDAGVKQFGLTSCQANCAPDDFTKAWDFGCAPGMYNSYSYNMPFARTTSGPSGYPVSTNSDPGTPLAADRNPCLDTNVTFLLGGASLVGGKATELNKQTPNDTWPTNGEYKDQDLVYNSFGHQREGQNVLFNDGHVKFEKQTNVGVDGDNIWQYWATPPPPKPGKQAREVAGYFPDLPTQSNAYNTYTFPMAPDDAYLVNEVQTAGSVGLCK